jgi:5-(carboxyamino)imidazole ribonucleotide synthase
VKPVTPGHTIGILGSGQLGRMLALEARRMGYGVHTFSPEKFSPTGQIADIEHIASYEDTFAASDFAKEVDVVTLEFENISFHVAKAIEEIKPIRPKPEVLATTQHRLREKNFLDQNHFPVTPFRAISSEADLQSAIDALGTPAILKTAGFGYDGKGQAKINSLDEALVAYRKMNGAEAILEQFVSFEKEISVVAARGIDGSFMPFVPVWNTHRNHILDVTIAPAPISKELANEAIDLAHSVMQRIDCVGVLCVEMFVTTDGKLIINELAPRPHNSGHWTIDGCITNQFEQQLRAVCGLSLGSAEMIAPCSAMVNLLGNIWQNGEPNFTELLKDPKIKLHLYGKHEPRVGRKMGHVNITGDSLEEIEAKVAKIKSILGIPS